MDESEVREQERFDRQMAREKAARDELERLREFERATVESEARCCPEDFGFEEWIGVLTKRLEAVRPEVGAPVDPESEAANPVWDLVIQTCAQAWGPGKLQWSQSPTELIVDIINARDDALADVKRLHEEKMRFFERTIELERELARFSPPAPIVATTAEWPFRREPMP